ncbi:MAG: M23 family metallopeptidase [Pseudomonadota bacterium]
MTYQAVFLAFSGTAVVAGAQTIEFSQIPKTTFRAPLPIAPFGRLYFPTNAGANPISSIFIKPHSTPKPWGTGTFGNTVVPSISFGVDDDKGATKDCDKKTHYYKHLGADYASPPGFPVYAIADGIVKRVNGFTSGVPSVNDWYVLVESGSKEKWTALYGHLNNPSLPHGLNLNVAIKKGDLIGTIYDYHYSGDIPHLHLGIHKGPADAQGVQGFKCASDKDFATVKAAFMAPESLKYETYNY